MHNSELVRAIGRDVDGRKHGARRRAVQYSRAFVRAVLYGLVKDGEVRVKDFGTFKLSIRKPQGCFRGKGESSIHVVFKSGATFKEALRDSKKRGSKPTSGEVRDP